MLVGVVVLAAPRRAPAAPGAPRTLPGWALYDRLCTACHGAAGDGQGPAAPYTWGRPRAFATGEYEWRSTPIGSPPTDDDLRRAIRHGASGTSMPGFRLTDAEVEQLRAVLVAFAPASFASPGKPIILAAAPAPDPVRGARLWASLGCATCHGATGAGDGPAAKTMTEPPYDLTADPLRRPRDDDTPAGRRHAAAMSIATGLSGTPMPGFADVIPDADVWALADHVSAINARAERRDRSAIDADEIAADRTARIEIGTWPGHGAPDDAALFGTTVPAQGPVPAQLPRELASLDPVACGRCHPAQYAAWRTTVHGAAASPGLIAQLDYGLSADKAASCRRCHTPLAEQRTALELRATGVSCGGCHVRGWTRHGPSDPSPAALGPGVVRTAGYPLVTQAIYQRADFCLPCHQLPPRTAVNGKPLLNTYKEWMEGPYPARGVACEGCHMPERAHLWRGIHDRDMVRQAIDLVTSAHRTTDAITVRADLRNRGAGHYLPTTPTPVIWLRIELVDARGRSIPGATSALRIGRDLTYDGAWHERADTRIPPGQRATMARAWTGGRTREATAARITVEVEPDAFYEGIYASRLRGQLEPAARALYEQALARARTSRYIADERTVPIAPAQRR